MHIIVKLHMKPSQSGHLPQAPPNFTPSSSYTLTTQYHSLPSALPATMSASRSYECLCCRLKDLSTTAPKIARRQFQTSTPKRARKPAFPNVKASELGLAQATNSHNAARVRPYTDREKELLAMKYTPDQLEAIEVGEQTIGDEDLQIQGRPRTDPMRISYYDDFSKIRPIIDHPASGSEDTSDIGALLKSSSSSSSSPETPTVQQTRQQIAESTDPRILRVSQQTGLTPAEIQRLRVKNLVSHRVVNQTRMGKIRSMYYLTIAGNGDGLLGVGEGKSVEPEEGLKQSKMAAIRNMRPVPRYEGRTIYGTLEKKVGATKVQLYSRPPGKTTYLSANLNHLLILHVRIRSPCSALDFRTCSRRWSARSRR